MDDSARLRPRKTFHSQEGVGAAMAGVIDLLPDELLALVLSKVAVTAASPADLANLSLTSPRFARLVRDPLLLVCLPLRALVPSAGLWADSHPPAAASAGKRELKGGGENSTKARMACRFLLQCGLAGCADALYVLGMIKFYCHRDFWAGASLLVWAAEKGHVAAIYSLAIIHSHGSGGVSSDGNPAAATDILWHAARAGSKQALQELGHCYLDGHGVPQRTLLGARLLLAAMCPAIAHTPPSSPTHAAVATRVRSSRAGAAEQRAAHAPRAHREAGILVESFRQHHSAGAGAAGAGAAPAAAGATGLLHEQPQPRRWLMEECRSELRSGAMASTSVAAEAPPPPAHAVASSTSSEVPGFLQGRLAATTHSSGTTTVSLQPVPVQGASLSMRPPVGQQGPVISIVRCAAGCHTAISVLSHSSSPSHPHSLAPCSSSSSTSPSPPGHSNFPPARGHLVSADTAQAASEPSFRWQASNTQGTPWHPASDHFHTPNGPMSWRTVTDAAAPATSAAAGMEAAAAAGVGAAAAAAATAAEQHGLTSKIAELFAPSGDNGSVAEVGQDLASLDELPSAVTAGASSRGRGMSSFFKEWSAVHGLPEGCRMCENAQCCRPETRAHEFRRCVVCERAVYCSRYCQVMDWKRIHYKACKASGGN